MSETGTQRRRPTIRISAVLVFVAIMTLCFRWWTREPLVGWIWFFVLTPPMVAWAWTSNDQDDRRTAHPHWPLSLLLGVALCFMIQWALGLLGVGVVILLSDVFPRWWYHQEVGFVVGAVLGSVLGTMVIVWRLRSPRLFRSREDP
jgi:hypothetical protein